MSTIAPARPHLTAAEAAVLDAALPAGATDDLRDMAFCLFEAMATMDPRAGQQQPDAAWLSTLRAMAHVTAAQLQHLVRTMGGRSFYLAKGMVMFLSMRDHDMCRKFRGNNYRELAAEFGLTEMRVRQIVDAWQREQFAQRQGRLPGLDDDGLA